MNSPQNFLDFIIGLATLSFLSIVGFLSVFRTNFVIKFYLKYYQKQYLHSLKKNFFLAKYYQAFTKFQYDLAKRNSKQKWFYYNMKICGVGFLLFALLPFYGVFTIIAKFF